MTGLLESGGHIYGIYTHFAKVFDTVFHIFEIVILDIQKKN